MNTAIQPVPLADAGVRRVQDFESPAAVPVLSTQLLVTAEGELNQELNRFLFDPPSDPNLLKGKKIAICCTNGVEEVEIIGETVKGDVAPFVRPREIRARNRPTNGAQAIHQAQKKRVHSDIHSTAPSNAKVSIVFWGKVWA